MTSSQWILFFFLITCLLHHAAAEEQYEIKAEPGEDVTLQCQDPRKVSIELIKWSKPDLKSEKYVYYFRDGSMCIPCQLESYCDRVELKDPEMKDGDVSVILKNVTINDTGTYECYVGHRQDVQLISIINLTVEPEITAKPGEDVTLQCQGPRDEAVLMLRWTRADLTAEDGYVFFMREKHLSYEKYQHESYRGRVEMKDPEMKDGDVSVILKNVNINDAGTYECYVKYRTGSELNNTINLRVEPGTNKDGGDEDGGDEDGGNTTLNVVVVLVLFLVVGIVGFWFYKKQRGPTDQSSYQQPPEQRTELQTVQTDSAAESSSPAPFKQQ